MNAAEDLILKERTHYHILLVEDQDDDIVLTQKAFRQVEVKTKLLISVATARNGVLALEYLCRTAVLPDLILIDIAMPIMGGIVLLQKLKAADSPFRMIPACMLTTSEHPDDLLASYSNYCSGYLKKPVAPDDFIALLSQVSAYYFTIIKLPPR